MFSTDDRWDETSYNSELVVSIFYLNYMHSKEENVDQRRRQAVDISIFW